MEQAILKLENITKSYDGKVILDDLDLEIGKNEFVTLLGPSGCGKTTTLRIIGGFEMPDQGRVMFEGQDITGISPDKRHINTVFQKYSLFSHMSVAENIAFGLKLKKKSKSYIQDKIKYALKLVDLDGFEHRKLGQTAPDALLGVVADRAGVDQDDIGLADAVRIDIAFALHERNDDLRVADVHLAAVGLDEKFAPGALQRP